jgi:two-component system, chemotaxis family, CheB/CheR fusion protein
MKNVVSPESRATDIRSTPVPTVVGIGASAGGLSAIKEFFKRVPTDSGLAFVVVVHLSPEHESHLADLLQTHVSMPVRQVSETMALEPNQVYVIPPGANLNAIDTHLRLSDLEESRRDRAPIDHFFRTLASTHDGHAVAVVLTGTGSDGTVGVREIKAKGGLTIVQDPNEAEYDGMPQSAIATGLIDLVLPLAEIPDAILRFALTEPNVPVFSDDERVDQDLEHLLQKVFALLRTRTSRDFSRYKRNTVTRRIQRRMQMHQIEELHDYVERLRGDADEAHALADDLLITVTNFFRDAQVFTRVGTEVLSKLFEGKDASDVIRVWCVGCATGEEAYTLAILLMEEAERHDEPPKIQIFASDLHDRSLKQARDGFYPSDIETDVSKERLERFFLKENGGYRIRKELREHVVFAPHNLLSDAPFSRIDLITCRNVLIYLQRDVQKDVAELFHYALKPNGYLLLGMSETLGTTDLFLMEHKPHCLYRRRSGTALEPRLPIFPTHHRSTPRREQGDGRENEPAGFGTLHQRMVERYAPPSMLVNSDDRIVHLSEHAGRYLVHPGGEITASVYKLIRDELRIELRSLLHAARQSQKPIRSTPVSVEFDGETQPVVIDVRPAPEMAHEGFALVIFDERVDDDAAGCGVQLAGNGAPRSMSTDGDANIAGATDLRAELDLTKQRLQAIIEKYETSQEEMKAYNEELQSAIEELRSTMEELETSKEELQSMNEELQTVNQENRHKVEELGQLSGDLQNLLTATDIATLFLDRSLRILRFTPRLSELFNIRTTDRGRPISDLTSDLGYEDLENDARSVLERLTTVERGVSDGSGRCYLTRVHPYRSSDDRIDGVVITFIDITSRKVAEFALEEARHYSESIVETLHEPLLVLTPDLHVKTVNQAFYDSFRVQHKATIGRKIYDLGNGQWDIPELHTLLEEVLPDSEVFYDYEVRHTFEDIGERVMLLNARRLDHMQLILLGIRDITDRKHAEEALRESEDRFRLLVHGPSEYAHLMLTPDGEISMWTDGAVRLFGYQSDEALGHHARMLFNDADQAAGILESELEAAAREGTADNECCMARKDGTAFWASGAITALYQDGGTLRGFAKVLRDNSKRKASEDALRDSEERFRAVADLVPDLLWRADSAGERTWGNSRWMEYTGQSPEEAMGDGWADTIHAEDRDDAIARYRDSIATLNPLWQEYRIRNAGGEYRWFLTEAVPVIDGDDSTRWYGSSNDINDQRSARDTLEERVAERTRAVRELSRRLTMAEQEERRRISQILHDDLQQLLYGIDMRMGIVQRKTPEAAPGLPEDILQVRSWISQAITTTRQLTVDLSPPILANEGLVDAMEWLQRQMHDLHGIEVLLEPVGEINVADEDVRVLLFQIVRELLFNVKKHAAVDHATVRLECLDGLNVITVIDEGRGFDMQRLSSLPKEARGFGLFSIEERMRLLGGHVTIVSQPGTGTTVSVHLP